MLCIKNCLQTLHDRLHMFIGGTVSNTAKIPSDDPLFFSLHSYVELMLTTTLLRSGENETNYPATGCLSDKLMYMVTTLMDTFSILLWENFLFDAP